MRISYLIVCISSIIYTQSTIATFSFKKMYNYVIPPKLDQEVIYEEYDPKKATLFTLKNKRGNVTIKTTQDNGNIFLKATKKSAEPEILPELTFGQKTNGQEFIIESSYDTTKIDGSIDFELVVPQKLALNISTEEGMVTTKDTQSPLRVTTKSGEIEIVNAQNSVDASTHTKGSITFRNPYARIKAQTNSGNIVIYNAQGSVFADANYGSIEMFAKDVPSTSTIKLSTISGSIKLHLPPDVNADLQAYTKQGTIISDHFITLKPQTTQLNKHAWKRLQKQVEGTLGTGEAQIKLSSVKSDIKLLEIKA